jgi:hypothetical protein
MPCLRERLVSTRTLLDEDGLRLFRAADPSALMERLMSAFYLLLPTATHHPNNKKKASSAPYYYAGVVLFWRPHLRLTRRTLRLVADARATLAAVFARRGLQTLFRGLMRRRNRASHYEACQDDLMARLYARRLQCAQFMTACAAAKELIASVQSSLPTCLLPFALLHQGKGPNALLVGSSPPSHTPAVLQGGARIE